MNEVADLLTRNRVVTIIGPGGIGKTRLALEVALGRRRSAYEGMWFVDFASIRDPLLIESRIASIVNVTLTSSKETSAALANALGARNVLLILDNCEHLLEPIGNTVTVIVGQCPNVRILATSREQLRLRAEAVYRLAPLTAPSRDPSTTAEALAYTSTQIRQEVAYDDAALGGPVAAPTRVRRVRDYRASDPRRAARLRRPCPRLRRRCPDRISPFQRQHDSVGSCA